MLSKLAVLVTACILKEVAAIGRSMADCEAIAKEFDNTCSNTKDPIDFVNHQGETMSCTGQMRCPGGDGLVDFKAESPCTWKRKLCITCKKDEDDEVYIRVQSNSLPNHCFYSHENNPAEVETDWTVKFNPDVDGEVYWPYK